MPRFPSSAPRAWLPAVLAAAVLVGCDDCSWFDQGDPGPDLGAPGSAGVGRPCTSDTLCRAGLRCDARVGTCQPAGTKTEGSVCQLTGECAPGLYCGPRRVCEPAGGAPEGADCATTADCAAGLLCRIDGFFTRCGPAGAGDLGDPCGATIDCLAGLSCSDATGRSVCASPAPTGGLDGGPLPLPSLPPWTGESCAEDPSGPPRAYFDVPRPGVSADFYRLPYPNDARRAENGRLDLSGHPHPGTALSIDVIDRYLRAAEADLDGFSTNPVVFFRFSRAYDWESVGGKLSIVDVTPGSPTYGAAASLGWLTTAGRITRYLCQDWLAVRVPHGAPLRPNTTYAALLSSGVRDSAGAEFQRSPDFDAVLAPAAPADPALARAHAAYAPLRAFLADRARDPAELLSAAVFTTQSVDDVPPALRAVIRGRAAPSTGDLTVCRAGVISPCDDGTPERACGPESPDFFEIHGRLNLPIFQAGTPPYETPEQGGGLERDDAGNPVVQRTEPVCFALTIPKGAAMPAEGWPLVLYAHGTGGSFRGALGLAAELSTGAAPAATLAIDLPQHGARRGGSARSPEVLFYNFANPRAARDNVMQGAADLFSLVHFAAAHATEPLALPEVGPARFDPARRALFAHSQGATHASLVVPYEPDLAGALLSGNGGDLTLSLLGKRKPVDVARLLPLALLDVDPATGGLVAGEWHPALALFQQYFDAVDPVNHGRRLAAEPPADDTGRHVFMTYGLGDTYATEATQQAYALSAGLPLVRPVLAAFPAPELDAPVSGNRTVGAARRTQALRQYAPDGDDDGHFVATRTAAGRADALRFLRGLLAGEVPVIGE